MCLVSFWNWGYEVDKCAMQVDTVSQSFELHSLMHFSISYPVLILGINNAGYTSIFLAHGLFS